MIMVVTSSGLVTTNSYQQFGTICHLHVHSYTKMSVPNHTVSHHKRLLLVISHTEDEKMILYFKSL